MEKLISIIIPVYNKAKYLHNCLQSLVDLDIDKEAVEVICIDDLSTDDSLEIIKEYTEKHHFIRVIELEENTGSPSTPRNIGMEEAKGTYLTLLDADDWLDGDGFPKLLYQMKENDADIGFGQNFKHTNKNISKMARFASYKNENNLVPYEIYKVFRAVGPPGKVFKRSVIEKYNLKFEHMKFGEDKLFFTELISRCENASMTDLPVYHVNRYAGNASLIKDTTILDKAEINMDILKKIMHLDIPEFAKNQAISRMVEVDFIRRYFHTKTFLRSFEKDKFYDLFKKMVEMFPENGFNFEDYIKMARFKNIYYLYDNHSQDDLEEYIEYLIDDDKKSKYIKEGVVQKRPPEKFSNLDPIIDECFPVYQGTHLIDDEFQEVIQVYKQQQVRIDSVTLSKIADETVQKKVDYQLKEDKIYIRTEDLVFDGVDINLRITFDGYKSAIVYSSLPNASAHYLQNRQEFKTEFKEVKETSLIPSDVYISVLPKHVVALKDIHCYKDEEFKIAASEKILAGSKVDIDETTRSQRGTPRLITKDGFIITANKKFVKVMNSNNQDGYITEPPRKVKIIKKCKLYDSRSFKTEPLKILEPGEELIVKDVVYTKNLTPRLKTDDDNFITANLNYVQEINYDQIS